MCGRFTLRSNPRQIASVFGLDSVSDLSPRYNIAPTQDVAAVRLNQGSDRRELILLHWGLIPSWAKDAKFGNRTINARAETIAEKPAFRSAFAHRRCLIVADGFYEWQKVGGTKQPFYIHRQDDECFAFAGLWESWKADGQEIESCTIITTAANDLMEPIHDRMPVILAAEDYAIWLDGKFKNKTALQDLLKPCDPNLLEVYPISTVVNNPRNESPQCLERAE